MKIMVVMGEYPPEEMERRRQAVRKCASPGTELGFSVIGASFFAHLANGEANALAVAPLVAEVAQRAEAEGYQAVVPFGTLDPGIDLARNLVRIPVVGAGQSVMHFGALLSRRMAVLVYSEDSIPVHRKNIRAWGLEDFVVSVRTIGIPLPDSNKQRVTMRERFLALARRAIEEDDAEIIVPMGVTMVPVQYSAAELAVEVGIPVLDALAVSIQTAEMMVRTGATHSLRTYRRPS